jgi:hypothetical protein
VTVAALALGLAGCGGAAAHPAHHHVTHRASAPAAVPLSNADMNVLCANLNALEYTGYSKPQAHSTVAHAYGYSAATVAAAIKDGCPAK